MARKFLYFIAVCIVIFVAGRIALQFYPEQLTRMGFTPAGPFEAQPALERNAYADPAMWLARPGMADKSPAAWRPAGFTESALQMHAAVFFVHPTTYLKKAHWNAPLDDADANRFAKAMVRGEASAFNRTATIWAPRYRQATFGAFVSDKPEAHQALDIAYADIAEAFDAFVAAVPQDEPILLVGHSQGSLLLKRLLLERIKGTALQRRIAAAYLIGWPVDPSRDPEALGLPACAAPDQPGCMVSWLSFADEADTAMMRHAYARFARDPSPQTRFLCSNPLTGGIGSAAPASANLGTLVPDAKLEGGALRPGITGARCAEDGSLRIGSDPQIGPMVLPGGNYHVYDMVLFWANLREDSARRVAAWKP
jgi:Protein of unknown function (DUF3089)